MKAVPAVMVLPRCYLVIPVGMITRQEVTLVQTPLELTMDKVLVKNMELHHIRKVISGKHKIGHVMRYSVRLPKAILSKLFSPNSLPHAELIGLEFRILTSDIIGLNLFTNNLTRFNKDNI